MSAGALMVLLLVAGTLPVLVRQLYPPLPPQDDAVAPACVVVLGAGIVGKGIDQRSSRIGLRRLAKAIAEARARGLPLLISGGGAEPGQGMLSEASLLAQEAQGYGLTLWLEEHSCNTRENARDSATLLRRKGIGAVLLVTDRAHMTRAMLCFRKQGVMVQAAPVERLPVPLWMPSAGALLLLPEIWYEWLALLWYQWRDFE